MPRKNTSSRRKANLSATARPRSGDENGEGRITLGSGAPVGLVVDGDERVGEPEEGSLMTRIQNLQEEYGGGVVERVPIGVDNGRLKYRFVYHMPGGAVIPGNGDTNADALANLEQRLAAWGASS